MFSAHLFSSLNITPRRPDVFNDANGAKQWNLSQGQPLKDGSFGAVQPNTSQSAQNAVACDLKNDGFANVQQAEHAHVCQKAHSRCASGSVPINPDTGAEFENEFAHMSAFFGNVPYDPSKQLVNDPSGQGLQLPAWHGASAPGYYETNLMSACPGSVYEQDFEHLNMFDRAGWAPCQAKDNKLQSLYARRQSCENQYVATHNKVLDRYLSTTNRPYNGNPAHRHAVCTTPPPQLPETANT